MRSKNLFIGIAILAVLTAPLFATGSQELTTEETEEPVSVLWYQMGSDHPDNNMVVEAMNEYLLEELNVTVDMPQIPWGDYAQRSQLALTSGDEIDIVFTAGWLNYWSLAEQGAFTPIEDLLDEYGQGILDAIPVGLREGVEVGGEPYAVQVYKDMAEQRVWEINKPIADKYGIDYTEFTDYESVMPALETVRAELEEDPDFWPMRGTPLGPWQTQIPYIDVVWPFGVYFNWENNDDVTYEIVNILETPELRVYVEDMRDVYLEEWIYNRDLMSPNDGIDRFETGQFFLFHYQYLPFHEYTREAQYGYPLPVVPMNENPVLTNNSISGALHAIPVTSTKPEEAMQVLNLLTTDQYFRNLVQHGIEGVHYEMIGDQRIRKLDRASQWAPPSWSMGNNDILYLLENDPEEKIGGIDRFNRSAIPNPVLGFRPSLDPVTNELAAINNAVSEYQRQLFRGLTDPDQYLDEYIEKVNASGADRVIAELQQQLDLWLATR